LLPSSKRVPQIWHLEQKLQRHAKAAAPGEWREGDDDDSDSQLCKACRTLLSRASSSMTLSVGEHSISHPSTETHAHARVCASPLCLLDCYICALLIRLLEPLNTRDDNTRQSDFDYFPGVSDAARRLAAAATAVPDAFLRRANLHHRRSQSDELHSGEKQ